VSEGIEKIMHTLRLGGLAKSWKEVEYRDKEQYVRTLLELELKEREVNRINRLVKIAGFRVLKTLEDFEWTNVIQMPQGMNREELETFRFVERKENLILLGAVGTGKTHLATGIALRACQSGKSARFFTAASLGNTLLEKNEKKTLTAFLETLKKVELMVLDEVGFVPLHQEASELLFQVISDCYEQKSLIITSNLEFRQWNTIFGDNRLTAALVDRLIHHSHIMVFSGDSYRLKQSMQQQRGH
jgi:DNA replication protein DnaC